MSPSSGPAREKQRRVEDEVVYLTLGDGDFTYSLDLARFLANRGPVKSQACRLISTGIDSLEALTAKYRDTPFVLGKLQSLNAPLSGLSVQVAHEINAIDASSDASKLFKANHVIFNHPHLGTEDAQLHSRFLRHLFHTVQDQWLEESGAFHLTLAAGQFERWRCDSIPDWHLVSRSDFVPPPVPDAISYYQNRRHQTGKSFASRVAGCSETFTFVRSSSVVALPLSQVELPSFQLEWYNNRKDVRPSASCEDDLAAGFQCPHCEKTFREARSVKNHVRSKHADDSDTVSTKKRKRDLHCVHCPGRVFSSEQALECHVQAKHTALHLDLTPDWCRPAASGPGAAESRPSFASCDVCRALFSSQEEQDAHVASFLPRGGEMGNDSTFVCDFCAGVFSEERAKRQHENSCAPRPASNDKCKNEKSV